jgi:hypothetical protein
VRKYRETSTALSPDDLEQKNPWSEAPPWRFAAEAELEAEALGVGLEEDDLGAGK